MTETPTPQDNLGFEDNKEIQDDLAKNQLPFDFVKEAADRAQNSQFVDLPSDREPLTGKQVAGRAAVAVAAAGVAVGAVNLAGAGVDAFFDGKAQADATHSDVLEQSEAAKQDMIADGVIGDTPSETSLVLEEQTPATSPTNIPTPKTH